MTHAEVRNWLAVREPRPPAPLAARLEHALARVPADRLAGAGTVTEALSLLGVLTLAALDRRPPENEDVALDLLAADAFVTYAFEAAAQTGASASDTAQHVLRQVTA